MAYRALEALDGMAPFAAKRAVSRASEAVFLLSPPHPPHTTATYLAIAGPSGAVKTGPTYLLHR